MKHDSFYKDLLDSIAEGVYFVDVNRKIKYWNKGAEHITGYLADEMLGHSCADNILVHVDAKGNNLCMKGCPLLDVIHDGLEHDAQIFLHHKDGHRIPVHVAVSPMYSDKGEITGAIEIFYDNSSTLKDKETIESLNKAVLIDSLTGIGNRKYIEMQLSSSFEQYKRYKMAFGVIMLDIDDFKNINDTYGHDAGDIVLKMVANTLAANVRSADYISRYGGEEFLGILQHTEISTFFSLAKRLRMLVEKCFVKYNGHIIKVTVTIGAAYVTQEDTPDTIVKRADDLLYKGKSSGKNKVVQI